MPVGTPLVIKLLEEYLELAKTRRWGHVAIAMTGYPGVGCGDYAGDIGLENATREALAEVTKTLERAIANRIRPIENKKLDASYVCYDMASGPIGFDFLVWLIDAEMTRRREGAPAPLKVAFWGGLDPERRMESNKGYKQLWLDNVFRPCLKFIGAVEDMAALHGRHKDSYVPRDIVAAMKVGEQVPRLKPVMPVVEHGAVTITLREAAYGVSRNSNVSAWTRFARDHLKKKAVFIRDTAKADETLPGGFKTDPRASHDLDYRLALYEGASANLFVSNGPAVLGCFGSKPCLMFMNTAGEETDEGWNTAEMFAKYHGIEVGEQFPWCNPDQRIVWQADTYENIVHAWNETLAQARAA